MGSTKKTDSDSWKAQTQEFTRQAKVSFHIAAVGVVIVVLLAGPVADVRLEAAKNRQKLSPVVSEVPLPDHLAPIPESGAQKLRQNFQVWRKTVRRRGIDNLMLKTCPVIMQQLVLYSLLNFCGHARLRGLTPKTKDSDYIQLKNLTTGG